MAAKSKGEPTTYVVAVVFAYANARNGEVVQLRKGDVVDPERFTPESIEHLLSIGFIA